MSYRYEELIDTIAESKEEYFKPALKRLLDAVREDFKAEVATIFWWRDGRLQRDQDVDSGPSLPFTEEYASGQSMTALVRLRASRSSFKRALIVNDLDKSLVEVTGRIRHPSILFPYYTSYQQALPSRQVRHLLVALLKGQRRLIGVLRLINRLDDHGYIDEKGFRRPQAVDLTFICERLAHALDYRELALEQQQQFEKEQRFYRIYDASMRSEEVFQTIVKEALRDFPAASKCEILRLDRSSQNLISIAVCHRQDCDDHKPYVPLVGINARAIREERIQFVPDTANDPDYCHHQPPCGALMVAPLTSIPGIIGLLTVAYDQPRQFTEGERQRFEALATHVRLAAAVIWRHQQTERLQQHIQQISDPGIGLKDIYRHVLRACRDLIGYNSASIQLYIGNALQVVEQDGFLMDDSEACWLQFDINDESYPSSHAWYTQQPLIVNDVPQLYPGFAQETIRYQGKPVQSLLYIPLLYRNRGIGIIALDSYTRSFYRAEDTVISTLIANAAASAIDNALLMEQLRKQQNQLRELLKRSTTLIEMQDEQRLLQSYAQLGKQLFACEHCAIFLRRSAHEDFALAISSQFEQGFTDRRYWQIAHEIAAGNQIVRLYGTTLIDFYAKFQLSGDELEHLPTARGRAFLAAPIHDQRQAVVGVLILENRESHNDEFTAADEDLLELFCEQVWNGFAIINLRRTIREHLGLDVHDLLNFTQSTIIFPLHRAIKQVEQNEPVDSIIQHLQSATHAAKFLYNQLLSIQDDLRGRTDPEQPFYRKIEDYVKLIQASTHLKNVDFHIDVPLEITLPPQTAYVLFRICQEALANIVKHADFNSMDNGAVWIHLHSTAGKFVLTIKDNGRGFTENVNLLDQRSTYGLKAIHQWAERIRGHATIQPRPTGGVIVEVTGQL
ncbi:MAG: GAF domain-containing protein [Chloroflexus sp.]